MRLIPAVLLVLLLTLGAAACGGPADGALDKSRAQEAKESGEGEATTTAEGDGKSMTEEDSNDNEKGEEGGRADDTKLDPEARELFVASCGSCHALADAKATGAVGPGLDDTPMGAEQVRDQIANGGGAMPPGLLSGEDADKVATYVAAAAAAG